MPSPVVQAPPKVLHTPANWLNCPETGSKSTLVECQGHGRIYSITVSLRDDPQMKMRPAGEEVGASALQRWAHSAHTLHDDRALCLELSQLLSVRAPAQILLLKAWAPTWWNEEAGPLGGDQVVKVDSSWTESVLSGNRPFFLGRTDEKPEAQESPGPAAPAPWSQTSGLQNGEQQVSPVYKLPSLRRFVVAAGAD